MCGVQKMILQNDIQLSKMPNHSMASDTDFFGSGLYFLFQLPWERGLKITTDCL